MTAENLVGKRFGRLLVTAKSAHRGKTRDVHWECMCRCGTARVVPGGSLKNGHTKSCGCFHKERITKHGMSHAPIWGLWRQMRRRCTRVDHKDYKHYGGRGITVCKRWLTFVNFYADMGDRPDGKTLDRIDNDGGYCPENCKWSTYSEQNRNRRKTVMELK